MSNLFINNDRVNSVFTLLGEKENNISYSVAYGLANCRVFLKNFMLEVGYGILTDDECKRTDIILQNFDNEPGITDIEIILMDKFHIIIEAKRGWIFPSTGQILKYSGRSTFKGKDVYKKLLVFNESNPEFTARHFPHKEIDDVPIVVMSWKQIKNIVSNSISAGRDFENRLLKELAIYLDKISTMQKKQNNKVYIVSLGGVPEGWNISFIDIVRKYNKYFHPVGGKKGGWPREPPNYIAFRYSGKLQSIHHIDSYEVFRDPNIYFPEIPSSNDNWELHYLYHLGPAMYPHHEVKAGAKIIRSMRVWAELDLLLTSSTIQEARDLSNLR